MKNGFTLVELLAVLVIIALLTAIVIPSYTSVYKDVMRSAYNSKKVQISEAAKKYGETIKDDVKDYKCVSTSVNDLIQKGLLSSESEHENVIYDPVTDAKMDGIVKICYCKSSFDIDAHYMRSNVDLNKSVINKGDYFEYNNSIYRCEMTYNPTFVGKSGGFFSKKYDIPNKLAIDAVNQNSRKFFVKLEC